MPLCADDLRDFVISETLEELELKLPLHHLQSAQELLLGTAAQESGLGSRMQQGRRLGLYQISPALHKSIWDNYLIDNPNLASITRGMASQRSFLKNPHLELLTNLKYATAIAMMVYLRCEQPLPAHQDINALAIYWHRHFHPKASNSTQVFIRNYRELVTGSHLMVA